MPVFAQPLYLFAAGGAAVVVVALHLLAWRRPTPAKLPTARFVPSSAVRAVSRAIRPSDLLLLLVRVAALLLAGVALAGPIVAPTRSGVARVLVVDASRSVASLPAALDSARAHAAGALEVVWVRVDSVAAVSPDSVRGDRAEARGRLSAGLVAAVRVANRLARTRESVEIVVVSPFAAESWDAATAGIRDAWNGAITLVRVAMRQAADADSVSRRELNTARPILPPLDDPVGAAFANAPVAGVTALRVTRAAPTSQDSAWARSGGVLIWWPSATQDNDGAADVAVAIVGDGTQSVAGHFAPIASITPEGRAILRWSDGRIAATEQPLGAGCVRTVAIDLPATGDEVLRPGVARLVRTLAASCGGGSFAAIPDSVLQGWASASEGAASPGAPNSATGATARGVTNGRASSTGAPAARPSISGDERASPTLTRTLLVVVAFLLLLEWWLRRPRGTEVIPVNADAPDRREAA